MFTFLKALKNYSEYAIKRKLPSKGLFDQANDMGFNIEKKKFRSLREAFCFIYGSIEGLPSLYEMYKGLPKFKLYKTDKFIDQQTEEIIQQKYYLAYVSTATQESLVSPNEVLENVDIEIELVEDEESLNKAVQFIEVNYYQKFQKHFNQAEVTKFREGALTYFKTGIVGKLYKKQGAIIGCLLISRLEKHHLILVPAIHLGYGGYDPELTSKSEVDFIKSDWSKSLRALAKPGDVFNASTHCFNPLALKFNFKMGFKLVGIRLDRKLETD